MRLKVKFLKEVIREEFHSLILEGRKEELKKIYPPDRVEELANLPINKATGNIYLAWMLKYGQGVSLQDLQDVIAEFNKNIARVENKDINSYKSLEDIKAASENLQTSKGEEKRILKSQTIFHDIGEPLMCFLTPTSKLSSKTYGRNTTWCIAAKEDKDNLFDHYTEDGSIFFFLYNKDFKPVKGLKRASEFETTDEYDEYIKNMEQQGGNFNKFAILFLSEKEAVDEGIYPEDEEKLAELSYDDKISLRMRFWNAIDKQITLQDFRTAVGDALFTKVFNFIKQKFSLVEEREKKGQKIWDETKGYYLLNLLRAGVANAEKVQKFLFALNKVKEVGAYELYNNILKIAKADTHPSLRELSIVDEMEFIQTNAYSALRENKKMKITKNYLKQIIKEELNEFLQQNYSDEQKRIRRERIKTEFGITDTAQQDNYADLGDQISTMSPEDLKIRMSNVPEDIKNKLRTRYAEQFKKAGI